MGDEEPVPLRADGHLTLPSARWDDLALLAPDVFTRSEVQPKSPGSIEDRFRQFDAVGRLLRWVTEEQPLVIVIDDAHWADEPSLLLLQHLARTVTSERLLMIVNHRDTEQRGGLPGRGLTKQGPAGFRDTRPFVTRPVATLRNPFDLQLFTLQPLHIATAGVPGRMVTTE